MSPEPLFFFWLLFSYEVLSNSFTTPWTIAHQAPLSMGFPRQEYWSELPFLSPGYLPDLGIKPEFPSLTGGFFTTEPSRKPSWGSQACIQSDKSGVETMTHNSLGHASKVALLGFLCSQPGEYSLAHHQSRIIISISEIR